MSRYYGQDTKQDLIDDIYECESDFRYRDAIYTTWLDGNGYNFAMTSFNGKEVSQEELDKTIVYADTVEELIDKFVLYDGARFADVIEKDVESYVTMKPMEQK